MDDRKSKNSKGSQIMGMKYQLVFPSKNEKEYSMRRAMPPLWLE